MFANGVKYVAKIDELISLINNWLRALCISVSLIHVTLLGSYYWAIFLPFYSILKIKPCLEGFWQHWLRLWWVLAAAAATTVALAASSRVVGTAHDCAF